MGFLATDQATSLSWALMEILSDHYNCDCFALHKDKRDVAEKEKSC